MKLSVVFVDKPKKQKKTDQSIELLPNKKSAIFLKYLIDLIDLESIST